MDDQDQASGVNLVVPPNLFLAQNPDVDFRETSFFKDLTERDRALPSPSEVDEREAQNPGRGVTVFEELNLVVKSGHRQHGRLEEALTMRALQKTFPNGEILVPEVFGWRTIGESEYIYMGLVPGVRLFDAWDSLSADDKASICEQLGKIQMELQKLKHPSGSFIGKQISHPKAIIKSQATYSEDHKAGPPTNPSFALNAGSLTGGVLHDRYFTCHPSLMSAGPFQSTKDFHDYFQFASLPWVPMAERDFEDPYRPYLPDDAPIRFSHGDLHLGNLIVSDNSSEPRRIMSIVDWEEAGWYPEYWEYCKMALVIGEEHEIWTGGGTHSDPRAYIDSIFPKRYHDELFAVGEYWAARGYP